MSGRFIFIVVGFLFFGCSISNQQPNRSVVVYRGIKPVSNSEDLKSLEALMYQYNLQDKKKALQLYKSLYQKSKKRSFLMEAIKLSFQTNDTASRDELIKEGLLRFPNNDSIIRFEVSRLVQIGKYKKAQTLMRGLYKKDKSVKNMLILASVYSMQKKYTLAARYYKKAYRKNYNEQALAKLALLLSEQIGKKQEAISILETHIRLKSASLNIYRILLKIYGEDYDVKGLISTYKLMYQNFKDDQFAKKVLDLYMYDKNRQGAIRFLEKTGYEPAILMDFYVEDKKYQKAYDLAKKLYEEYGDTQYLGRMAIYEYENNKDKLTSKIFRSISKKFETVIEKMQTPLYLNYYGYLLIDHDIDVQKGIKYVKMALEKEPQSVYYVDSLAWGYYKLKKCQKALETMQSIIDKTNEKEIKEHYKIINKCIKKQK